jgi:hypothetical protein
MAGAVLVMVIQGTIKAFMKLWSLLTGKPAPKPPWEE